jgi:hypothetical protein
MHVPTDREVLCLFPVTFMHSVAAATLDPKVSIYKYPRKYNMRGPFRDQQVAV